MQHWQIKADEYLQRLKKPRVKKYYRCAKPCRTRKVLNRELWEYIRPPKCSVCGRMEWQLDMHRTNDQKNKTGSYVVCCCDGAWYPHRPGSIELCCEYKGELE